MDGNRLNVDFTSLCQNATWCGQCIHQDTMTDFAGTACVWCYDQAGGRGRCINEHYSSRCPYTIITDGTECPSSGIPISFLFVMALCGFIIIVISAFFATARHLHHSLRRWLSTRAFKRRQRRRTTKKLERRLDEEDRGIIPPAFMIQPSKIFVPLSKSMSSGAFRSHELLKRKRRRRESMANMHRKPDWGNEAKLLMLEQAAEHVDQNYGPLIEERRAEGTAHSNILVNQMNEKIEKVRRQSIVGVPVQSQTVSGSVDPSEFSWSLGPSISARSSCSWFTQDTFLIDSGVKSMSYYESNTHNSMHNTAYVLDSEDVAAQRPLPSLPSTPPSSRGDGR